MGIYVSHNGTEKDTADMPTPYLENALLKAQAEGNKSNIDVLEAELAIRQSANVS